MDLEVHQEIKDLISYLKSSPKLLLKEKAAKERKNEEKAPSTLRDVLETRQRGRRPFPSDPHRQLTSQTKTMLQFRS